MRKIYLRIGKIKKDCYKTMSDPTTTTLTFFRHDEKNFFDKIALERRVTREITTKKKREFPFSSSLRWWQKGE